MENFTIKQKVTGLEKKITKQQISKYAKKLKTETSKLKNASFGLKYFNNFYHPHPYDGFSESVE